MYPSLDKMTRIASIGGGPIGAGWAAYFLARGFDVTSYLHDMAEEKTFHDIVDTAWVALEELGLALGASKARLTLTDDLAMALDGVDFVQESAPENMDIKKALYQKLDDILPKHVVIGSSTSGLPMSDIQADTKNPERMVVGHPFNPPYLLPLVEIIGGDKTAPEAIQWAEEFYNAIGKKSLVMMKEIPGFVATRLQEALWREALHMVANHEATPKQIDDAIMHGMAPRMAILGQCMAFHVACGEGGMATNLQQFGPALKLPWTRLEAPELTDELYNLMVDGCNDIAGNRSFTEMAAERDRAIVGVLKAVRNAKE